MRKFICTICGYIYDESAGAPGDGIAPGTAWEDVPESFVCPICKASKSAFKEQQAAAAKQEAASAFEGLEAMRAMTPAELAALCSNLSKGFEKQYKPEEAGLFMELAAYFDGQVQQEEAASIGALKSLLREDLDQRFPKANAVAAALSDRGSLRALAWSGKASRMVASILDSYEKDGEKAAEDSNVYVCEICGFIYIGDEAPAICPVCKVPSLKIAKVERR